MCTFVIIHLSLPWVAQCHNYLGELAISVASPYDMSVWNVYSRGMCVSVHLDGYHIFSGGEGRDVERWGTANEYGELERDVWCLIKQERCSNLSPL